MKPLLKFSNIPLLFVLCGLIYFPFLGEVNLFDWDETLLAAVSKSMYNASEILEPILGGQFYLEKPPMFFWMQLISFKYLGINEYAARFPNAICGLIVVITLYKNGSRIFSRLFGMVWALVYLSMMLPQLYQKSGLSEPWFNLFIYLSLYNLSRIIEKRQEIQDDVYRKRDINKSITWSALATAGAMLINGLEAPVLIWMSYILVFLLSSAMYGMGYKNFFKWFTLVVISISIWVLVEYKWHGGIYLQQFFSYQWNQYTNHEFVWSDRLLFQILVLLLGCFPASPLAFNSLRVKTYEYTLQKVIRLMMFSSLIAVIVIAFSYRNQLVHYTSYAYIPISFFAAYSIHYIIRESKRVHPMIILLIFLVGTLWSLLLIIVPLTNANLGTISNFINNETLIYAFTRLYSWQSYEVYFGLTFFILLLFSVLLLIMKKTQAGIFVLFTATMIYSQIILVYYMPNIERITQGAQVDFVINKKDEACHFHYLEGPSFISNVYSDSAISHSYGYEIPEIKDKYPLYLMKKTLDTSRRDFIDKHFDFLYRQDLYSFYEEKK